MVCSLWPIGAARGKRSAEETPSTLEAKTLAAVKRSVWPAKLALFLFSQTWDELEKDVAF